MSWHEYDGTAAEHEMREMIGAMIGMIQPDLVVETGTYLGLTAQEIAYALFTNKRGRLVSCEVNHEYVLKARKLFESVTGTYAREHVEIRECPSLDLPELAEADFVFLDSNYDIRPLEYAKVKRGATVIVHDTGDAAQQYSNDPARTFHLGRWCREQGMLVWPNAGRGFAIGVKQ